MCVVCLFMVFCVCYDVLFVLSAVAVVVCFWCCLFVFVLPLFCLCLVLRLLVSCVFFIYDGVCVVVFVSGVCVVVSRVVCCCS